MDSDRVEVLLLKLIEDVAEIKGKLNILEEIKIEQKELTVRVDRLEAKGDRHEKQITSSFPAITTSITFLNLSVFNCDNFGILPTSIFLFIRGQDYTRPLI